MDLSTFIVAVFCLIDDRLKGKRIRQRGPSPKLSDAEVITIEIVGEFLGLDTDRAIRRYFRRHYAEWFPALGGVHRTTFARQAANLCKVKERLWQELLSLAPHDPTFALCDSMPLPACLFARAYRCRRFRGEPRGSRFRQGYPPQADLLRLQGARASLLARGDHPFFASSCKRPRALRAP